MNVVHPHAHAESGGFLYAVEIPGAEDTRILADERQLEEIYSEAFARGWDTAVLHFKGITVDGEQKGRPVKILLGDGFVHEAPGLVITPYDPTDSIAQIAGFGDDAKAPPAPHAPAPAPEPTRPAIFPRVK